MLIKHVPLVAILSIHPAPYRDYVFQALYQRGRLKPLIWYYFPIDHGHKEWQWRSLSYPCFFSKYNYSRSLPWSIHLDILWRVATYKYDLIIIPGYSKVTSLISIIIAIFRQKPVVLALDSAKSKTSRAFSSFWIQLLRSLTLRSCKAYWVPGFASSCYLESMGIKSRRVAHGSYCLDAETLSSIIKEMRKNRCDLRNNLGIQPTARVVLAVGKMTAFRKYNALITAWAALHTTSDSVLLFVGDGPLYEDLVFLVKKLQLPNVMFAGACSTEDLPKYYALSDAFIHPGLEPYSTALEIAAIAGLPILANTQIGYIKELLERGASPLLFAPNRFDDLTAKLEILISDNYQSASPGLALAKVAKKRTPDWAANEIESLVLDLSANKA